MVRKLSLALALAMGLSPFSAGAVGLGDIELKSALNQNFNANINLLSVNQSELDDIKVTLATGDAFRRAGVDRLFILTKLRFSAVMNDDGTMAIRVISRDPIREPFLNFLVEVNWPKGKLVREYTVLLDPPVTLNRRPAPVQAAPMRSDPARQSVVSPSYSAAPTGRDSGIGEYGPTQKNDTLWGIASRVRHQGVSMEQMMISLLEANPQAFINRNINNLKVGQILRVPQRDEVVSLTRREATVAYRSQLNDWQADRAPVDRGTISREAVPAEPKEQPVRPEAELKIASAKPSEEGTAGADGEDKQAISLEGLQQDLLAAEEAKQAAIQDEQEQRSRVDALESQLEDLQRLLTLKNDQLAKLQSALGEEAAAEESAPTEQMADALNEEGHDALEQAESTVGEMVEQAEEAMVTELDEHAEDAMPAGQAEAEHETASTAMAEVEPMEAEHGEEAVEAGHEAEEAAHKAEEAGHEAEEAEHAEEEAHTEAEPTAGQTPVASGPQDHTSPGHAHEGILDKLLNNTLFLGAAVAGIVVLLALLWVAISRRRSSTADFQESILVSTIDEADSEELTQFSQEPEVQTTEETSFLSDFSPSDIDALQDETGEVDPVAEADVYIAYGRYQQAEELIRQAIDKDPGRVELKDKLFEILFATKDSDAYVALAEQQANSGLPQKDPASWGKIVSMGGQLLPAHALFSGDSVLDDGEATLVNLDAISEDDDSFALDEISDLLDSDDLPSEPTIPEGLAGMAQDDESPADAKFDFTLDLENADDSMDERTLDELNLDELPVTSRIQEESVTFEERVEVDQDADEETADSLDFDLNLESSDADDQGVDVLSLGDGDATVIPATFAETIEVPESDESETTPEALDDDFSVDLDGGLDADSALELAAKDLDEIDKSLDELGIEDDGASSVIPADVTEFSVDLDDVDSLTVDLDADSAFDIDLDSSAEAEAEKMVSEPTQDRIDSDTYDLDMTLSNLDNEALLGDDNGLNIEDTLETAELDDLQVPSSDQDQPQDEGMFSLDDLDDGDSSFASLEVDADDDSSVTTLELDVDDDSSDISLDMASAESNVAEEVDTKLDLARAYIDMEDAEGARSILDEVISEGNDSQKDEAKKMIEDLG